MSRRTKLIILTITLVLLTIPVVYLFLTWSPDNPLRFRTMDYEDLGDLSEANRIFIKLEVRNTAPVSIHFDGGVAQGKDPEGREIQIAITPEFQFKEGKLDPQASKQQWIIPPQGVIHCTGFIFEGDVGFLASSKARTDYAWLSAPKYHCGQGLDRVRRYLPSKLSDMVPKVNFSRDETDLEGHLPEKR